MEVYHKDMPNNDGPWEHNDIVSPPPDSMFGWVSYTWNYDLTRMAASHGLDAALIAAFLRYVFFLFCVVAVYGIVVLTPVHLSSDPCSESTGAELLRCQAQNTKEGLLKLTLGNIANGSPLLWFHLIGVYIYSFSAYYAFFKFYKWYAEMRIRQMSLHTPCNYTVCIREMPKKTPSGDPFDDIALRRVFEFLYPGEVVGAHVAPHMPKVEKLREERMKAVRALEKAAAQNGIDPYAKLVNDEVPPPEGDPPTAKAGAKLGCLGGEKVDAMEHWGSEVSRLGDEIAMELEEERTKLTKTGFVTFKTISRAFQVQQTLLERRTFKFKVEPASTARDIIWKNLNIDDKMFWGRSIVVNAVVFFLIFFWSTPIGLVTSLVQLKSLARLFRNTFGWTAAGDFIDDIPDWLAGPLSSYLPIILLAVFLAIVPMLLELLARAQGLRSSSSVETAVVERYYSFIVVNVILVVTLAGAMAQIFSFFQEIVENPPIIADLLGSAVPQQAFFFTFYLAQAAMGTLAISLLRPGPLIVGLIKKKFLAKSARERLDAFRPVPYPVGPQMARHLLLLTIALTFSIAMPLILVFSLAYFGCGHLYTKYNLLFCHTPTQRGNGRMFESLFLRGYASLCVFQIACIGIFSSKSAIAQAPFILLLLPMSFVIFRYTTTSFKNPARFLNMMEAHALALKSAEAGRDGSDFKMAYRHAMMSEDPLIEEILGLLRGTKADPKAADPYAVIDEETRAAMRRQSLAKKRRTKGDDNDDDDETESSDQLKESKRRQSKSKKTKQPEVVDASLADTQSAEDDEEEEEEEEEKIQIKEDEEADDDNSDSDDDSSEPEPLPTVPSPGAQ